MVWLGFYLYDAFTEILTRLIGDSSIPISHMIQFTQVSRSSGPTQEYLELRNQGWQKVAYTLYSIQYIQNRCFGQAPSFDETSSS